MQKYCSNTCRSKAWQENNNQNRNKNKLNIPSDIKTTNSLKQDIKIDKVSLPGIANAAIGNVTVDAIKSFLIPEHKKAATKGDINELFDRLDMRYHLVKNMPQDDMGRYPHYDITNGFLVYL